mmetsp:Transcript_6198/g.15834  ORF Transcript_6198/g.15834 Transcript_6198/m.15834 type:complete len:250 (-) Transcript_6198:1896-2645(-)
MSTLHRLSDVHSPLQLGWHSQRASPRTLTSGSTQISSGRQGLWEPRHSSHVMLSPHSFITQCPLTSKEPSATSGTAPTVSRMHRSYTAQSASPAHQVLEGVLHTALNPGNLGLSGSVTNRSSMIPVLEVKTLPRTSSPPYSSSMFLALEVLPISHPSIASHENIQTESLLSIQNSGKVSETGSPEVGAITQLHCVSESYTSSSHSARLLLPSEYGDPSVKKPARSRKVWHLHFPPHQTEVRTQAAPCFA